MDQRETAGACGWIWVANYNGIGLCDEETEEEDEEAQIEKEKKAGTS